jgi:hypothetical protein
VGHFLCFDFASLDIFALLLISFERSEELNPKALAALYMYNPLFVGSEEDISLK